jgi:hypothetical protein
MCRKWTPTFKHWLSGSSSHQFFRQTRRDKFRKLFGWRRKRLNGNSNQRHGEIEGAAVLANNVNGFHQAESKEAQATPSTSTE